MFTVAKDAMSNATLTTKDDYLTIDEWLVLRDKAVSQVKELVRLWFVNQFGSQRALAKHLCISSGAVNYHVKLLKACGELTEQHAPTNAQNSKNASRSNFERPVEKLSTTVCSQSSRHDQPSHTEPSIRSSVQVVQPIVDTYSDGQDERVVSMGTASDRDWEQAVAHLQALRQFTHDYFDPNGPISEQQWEQFHAECHDLAYFARMRCSNLRERNEQAAHAILGAVFNDGDSSIQEA